MTFWYPFAVAYAKAFIEQLTKAPNISDICRHGRGDLVNYEYLGYVLEAISMGEDDLPDAQDWANIRRQSHFAKERESESGISRWD